MTGMPAFSSDVQQYIICKSGGAHGFATMHYTHTQTHLHTHTHTHTNTSAYSEETHKYLQAHTRKQGLSFMRKN